MIMEAMKMDNNIVSEKGGVVKADTSKKAIPSYKETL